MSSIGKASLGALLVAITLFISLIALIIGAGVMVFMFFMATPPDSADCQSQAVEASTTSDGGSLTIKGVKITPEQLQNAVIIVKVAVENVLPVRAAEIAIMTAIQESTLINLPYGDRDSVGLFQQRDLWGPRRVRMNAEKSSQMYYTGGRRGQQGLVDIEGWESLPRGEVAQAVQVSAYPDAYADHEVEAIAIVAQILGDESVVQASQDCVDQDPIDPIEIFVQAGLSRVGSPMDTLSSAGAPARIATYNVLGSNHTSSESAMKRIVTSAALIKSQSLGVVGLQELRLDQRERLMELIGDSYDIYPKTPVYGESQLSVNSIIWDTSQFELVDARPTPMPFYFGGQSQDIPLVELRHESTGTTAFYFNTHDPAHPENARLRYLNAQEHAELTDKLVAAGNKVFAMGDFNSGFGIRNEGNTTYLQDRQNLTWCIMTRSGNMVNGYDDARDRTGCPQATTNEMGVGPVDHVYIPVEGVETTNYRIINDGLASDHPLVYAEVLFGSTLDSSAYKASAGLVSWAATQAEFKLPDTLAKQIDFASDTETGLVNRYIDGDAIRSGEESLKRGDMLYFSDEPTKRLKTNVGSTGIYTGTGSDTFTAGTLNILHAVSHPGSKCRPGESLNECVDRRSQLQAEIISGEKDNPKLDLLLLQEVSQPQYAKLKELLPGYGFWPEDVPEARGLAIMWDKTQFAPFGGETSSGSIETYDNAGDRAATPWITLLTPGGQIVSAMSIHAPNNQSGGSPLKRSYNSTAYRGWSRAQLSFGRSVVFGGDFNRDLNNSTEPRQDGHYCIITEGGEIQNAFDLAKSKKSSTCPTRQGLGIDHLYVASPSSDVVADDWKHMPEAGVYAQASDHEPVLVTIRLGSNEPGESELGKYVGVDSGEVVRLLTASRARLIGVNRPTVTTPGLASGEWVFPIQHGTYNISSPYGPRDLSGDDFHSGADYGTSGFEAPLVAMHRGTIISALYDDAWGNYLMVETNIPVPDMPGSTYKYMYAHLSRFEFGLVIGQTLEMGDSVGSVGDTGNSFGEHLHLSICTSMDCLSGDKEGTVDPAVFLETVGITP